MAIPVQAPSPDHVGLTGLLPEPPRLPGASQQTQTALDNWWTNARQKVQSDNRSIKAAIEDLYRRMAEAAAPVDQTSTTINNNTTNLLVPHFYMHVQNLPADVWVITHNLGQYAQIALLDNNWEEIEGEIQHQSVDTVWALFNFSATGKALCK